MEEESKYIDIETKTVNAVDLSGIEDIKVVLPKDLSLPKKSDV